MAGEARRIVLLGAPGCGKGTQAARIAAALEIPAISTGDMLRAAVQAGSALGERVGGILNAGELVDDATMAEVVTDRLAQPDAADGYLLDGYPRTQSQADTLAGILDAAGQELDRVIQIDVAKDELVRRALGRQRADDTEEVIRKRLEVYEENTAPLVDYYRDRGMLRAVDGNQSIEDVTRSIMKELEAGG